MDLFFLNNLLHPILFLVLISLFIWVILFLVFSKKNKNFTDSYILTHVYKRNTFWQKIYFIVIWLICLWIIIAISGPFSRIEKQIVTKEWIDIQIVLDMSYSMIAEDIIPTRINVAKQMLANFISEIYSDRVGIILFSWKPFQSVPLSYDYSFLQEFLSSVSVDIVNQSVNDELAGTALWDGLVLASDVLTRDYPEREKVIILITDGEANKWVEPDLALRLLKDQGIKSYTIWVWKSENTTITFPRWNFTQQIQIWWIDEEILRKISEETWGEYFRADSSSSFRKILDTIAQLEKTKLEYESYIAPQSNSQIFFTVILFLLWILTYIHFYKNIRL